MKLSVLSGFIEVEGDPVECAIYTHALLKTFKMEHDLKEKLDAKREADVVSELLEKTFAELMEHERNTEEKEEKAEE